MYGSFYSGAVHPKSTSGGIYFDFPQSNSGSFVGYYTTNLRPSLALSGTLSMTFTINTTGSPVFNYMSEAFNTCTTPASVRPLFWGAGDATNDGRWWSNPVSYTLAAGTVTLNVPLTADNWSDVNGQRGTDSALTIQSFQTSLASVNKIGMTFGGGCFFGHGVNVYSGTGTANFILQNYSIN